MENMRFVVLSTVVLLLSGLALAQKKPKQEKPPEIELIEGTAHRQAGGNIAVDGKIRNCGDKPIKNLVIFFHFLDSDRQVITTRKGGVEQPVLNPGDESEFHAQLEQPPRATYYRIEFEDGGGKYLRPAKPPETSAIE
jgi:hypothetical protein